MFMYSGEIFQVTWILRTVTTGNFATTNAMVHALYEVSIFLIPRKGAPRVYSTLSKVPGRKFALPDNSLDMQRSYGCISHVFISARGLTKFQSTRAYYGPRYVECRIINDCSDCPIPKATSPNATTVDQAMGALV